MRLWIDNIAPAPEGYYWCKDVDDAKRKIELTEAMLCEFDCDESWDIGINNVNIRHGMNGYDDFIKWNKETFFVLTYEH